MNADLIRKRYNEEILAEDERRLRSEQLNIMKGWLSDTIHRSGNR